MRRISWGIVVSCLRPGVHSYTKRCPFRTAGMTKKLIEDDVLIPSANASTRTLRVQGAVQRVLKLVKSKALPTEPESE